MINRITIFLITITFYIFSCEKPKEKLLISSIKNTSLENIIQKAINTEKLNFYNNSLNNIKYGELVIIENEKLNINDGLNLTRLGKIIKIVPYSKIKRDSLYNYFLFKEISIINDSSFIQFYHNFENFDCEITMMKENNKWKEKKVLIIQY